MLNKKIDVAKAIQLFTEKSLTNSSTKWNLIETILNNNNQVIFDLKAAQETWVFGILAIDSLYAYQVFEKILQNYYQLQ